MRKKQGQFRDFYKNVIDLLLAQEEEIERYVKATLPLVKAELPLVKAELPYVKAKSYNNKQTKRRRRK